MTGRLDDLDDPAYTTGRAAEVLGVQQAFLRSLDAAGAVRPDRSAGGRRRYSRRQLAIAARIRELFDQGHTPGRRATHPGSGRRPGRRTRPHHPPAGPARQAQLGRHDRQDT
jgi:hypothetical protein